MRKLLSALFFMVFALSSTLAQDWQTYDYPLGQISINFPAEPTYKFVEKENTNTHRYSVTLNDHLYLLSFTIHELKITDYYGSAEISLEEFTKSLGGEVLKVNDFKYKKHKGKMTAVAKDNAILLYKVIIIDQIQYQLIYSMLADENKKMKLNNKFFKSFKVEQ